MQTLGTSATLFEFQPIPIHVGNIDAMMRGMDSDICPYQSTLRSKFVGSGSWNDLNNHYQKSLFPEMEENWNVTAETLDFTTSYEYIDNYYSAWFDQMTIPNELSKEAKTEVDMILRDGLYQGFFSIDLAVRLATTRFFNFLHTTLQLKIGAILEKDGIPSFYEEIKFMYLSAHDSSLTAFLSGLLQKQDTQMFFASSLLIELYQTKDAAFKNNTDFWVVMKINNKTINIGTEKVCGKICQFETVKNFLISREYKGDIDKICQEGEPSSLSATVWLWLLFATALFVFLSIGGYFITRTVFMKQKADEHSLMVDDDERAYDKAGLNTSHSNATPATSRVITDDGDSD